MGIESFDQIPNSEKEPVRLTREEFDQHHNLSVDDPDLINWMESKGINFDSGEINVEIDGIMGKMQTSKDDFGTTALESDQDIPSGY